MARKIQHKRGLEANLPQLDVAEIAFTTDSKKPFIGSADGNIEIAKKKDVDEALANKANATTVQGLSQTVNAKADVEYVETELAKKADKTALETKADVTALETKADKEEVTTLSAQLAEKASQADVTAAVEPKADKIYVDAELGKKATKGEIAVTDIDKNKGKFDQTYMTDEFLQQMAGNTPINATPADDSITSKKLTNLAVTLPLLSTSLKSSLYTEFKGTVQNFDSPNTEVAIGTTAINRDKIPQTGVLGSITVSVAIPGTITLKVFSRNEDNTFNLEWEFPLTVKAGIQTFYAGKDFPEKTVNKNWFIGYHSTNARLFGKTGAFPSNYAFADGVAQGDNIEMKNYGVTSFLSYTISKLNSEIKSFEDELNKDRESLLTDLVASTHQDIKYNPDGNVSEVTHTNIDGKIKRWDSFRYFRDKVIETRMSAKGNSLEIEYDLVNYVTKINVIPPPNNLLSFDPIDWKEWTLAPNASIADGSLNIIGNGKTSYSLLDFEPKPSTKYGILVNVLENTITSLEGLLTNDLFTGNAMTVVPPLKKGNSKLVFTTKDDVDTNKLTLGLSSSATSGVIVIKNIAIIEIPLKSQMEYDFENYAADQLVDKYIRTVE